MVCRAPLRFRGEPPPGPAGSAHVPVPCLKSTVVRVARCGLRMECVANPRNFSRQIGRVALMRRHARPSGILCVWHNFDGALCVRVCRVLRSLGWLGYEHARLCGCPVPRVLGEAGVRRPYDRGGAGEHQTNTTVVVPPTLGSLRRVVRRAPLRACVQPPPGPYGAACVPVPCWMGVRETAWGPGGGVPKMISIQSCCLCELLSAPVFLGGQ